MKINIIGGPGSGKTTIAKILAEKMGITIIHSDSIIYRYKKNGIKAHDKNFEKLNREVLQEINSKSDWIYEGRHLFKDVLKNADKIVWLNIPLHLCVYRQWKRYLRDPIQRKDYGLKNNMRLTRDLIKDQYLGENNMLRMDDPLYSHNKKIEKMLELHINKVIVLRNRKDIKFFLQVNKIKL